MSKRPTRIASSPRLPSRVRLAALLAWASAATALSGCFTDGPVGFVPGGAFSAELERGPEPDWRFATDVDSVDIQIHAARVRTVRTGIVVHEGTPYLPVTWSPLKRWPAVV